LRSLGLAPRPLSNSELAALGSDVRRRAIVLFVFVGLMWFVRLLDTPLLGSASVVGTGVIPRTYDGLFGIITAPLIHSSWSHLMANTPPLLVFGALILLRGVEEFIFVTLCTALISGAGVWLFGSSGNHVGASGLIYGFAGYLLFRAAFDRQWGSVVITVLVAVTYSTGLAMGLVPQDRISWTGHFFGFIGGVVAARLRYPGLQKRVTA